MIFTFGEQFNKLANILVTNALGLSPLLES